MLVAINSVDNSSNAMDCLYNFCVCYANMNVFVLSGEFLLLVCVNFLFLCFKFPEEMSRIFSPDGAPSKKNKQSALDQND